MRTATQNEDSTLIARMREVAGRFRVDHPLSRPPWSSGSYPLPANVAGRPDVKVLVWFPSAGCRWSLNGGCTFCNFGSVPNVGSVQDALLDFDGLLSRLDPGVRRLHIAPGGSFFDDVEVPDALRRGVLGRLHQFPFLEAVGMETRPNLLSKSKLFDVVDELPPQVRYLTIGFGFECLTDLVREVAVNKGYGRVHVQQAAEVIGSVNAAQSRVHVTFEVYVMLKPVFVTEREAVEEAIRTVDWVYEQGAETAVLFLNTVKANTVQGYLSSREDLLSPIRYEPPFYRSAVQVLRALPPQQRGQTAVLGVQSGVLAKGLPRGCPLCKPFLLGALMAHNFTRDPRILDEAANCYCPCRDDWAAELETASEDLHDRIRRGLDVLEQAFPATVGGPESTSRPATSKSPVIWPGTGGKG